MNLKKNIFKNTLSNWAGIGINILIIMALTPYLLKSLGNERYGIYQIIVPITQYLILLELGMRGAIARYASKYIADKDILSLNKVISTTFVIGCCTGLIALIVCYFLGLQASSFYSQSYIAAFYCS